MSSGIEQPVFREARRVRFFGPDSILYVPPSPSPPISPIPLSFLDPEGTPESVAPFIPPFIPPSSPASKLSSPWQYPPQPHNTHILGTPSFGSPFISVPPWGPSQYSTLYPGSFSNFYDTPPPGPAAFSHLHVEPFFYQTGSFPGATSTPVPVKWEDYHPLLPRNNNASPAHSHPPIDLSNYTALRPLNQGPPQPYIPMATTGQTYFNVPGSFIHPRSWAQPHPEHSTAPVPAPTPTPTYNIPSNVVSEPGHIPQYMPLDTVEGRRHWNRYNKYHFLSRLPTDPKSDDTPSETEEERLRKATIARQPWFRRVRELEISTSPEISTVHKVIVSENRIPSVRRRSPFRSENPRKIEQGISKRQEQEMDISSYSTPEHSIVENTARRAAQIQEDQAHSTSTRRPPKQSVSTGDETLKHQLAGSQERKKKKTPIHSVEDRRGQGGKAAPDVENVDAMHPSEMSRPRGFQGSRVRENCQQEPEISSQSNMTHERRRKKDKSNTRRTRSKKTSPPFEPPASRTHTLLSSEIDLSGRSASLRPEEDALYEKSSYDLAPTHIYNQYPAGVKLKAEKECFLRKLFSCFRRRKRGRSLEPLTVTPIFSSAPSDYKPFVNSSNTARQVSLAKSRYQRDPRLVEILESGYLHWDLRADPYDEVSGIKLAPNMTGFVPYQESSSCPRLGMKLPALAPHIKTVNITFENVPVAASEHWGPITVRGPWYGAISLEHIVNAIHAYFFEPLSHDDWTRLGWTSTGRRTLHERWLQRRRTFASFPPVDTLSEVDYKRVDMFPFTRFHRLHVVSTHADVCNLALSLY